MSRFEPIVDQFSGWLVKLRQPDLAPMDAMNQFHVWMGGVQQALHLANRELNQQLPELRAQGEDSLAILKRFGEHQSALASVLDEMSNLLKDCTTVAALQAAEPALQQHLVRLQQVSGDFDLTLEAEDEEPGGPGPLPDPVRECLDRLQESMESMVRFTEERDPEDLYRLADQLDAAREVLGDYLDDLD